MSYQASQERIVEAEAAQKAGDTARARALFREAAQLQRAFVDSLPPERVRTKSVYGLSVASLLYRAGDLDEAERLAGQLLGEAWIEPHAADEIRALLAQIWLDRGEPSPSVRAAQSPPPRPPVRAKRRSTPHLPIMKCGRRLATHLGVRA